MSASYRKDIIIRMDGNPWEMIINQIDEALAKIHFSFHHAFAEGKEKSIIKDREGLKQEIFDELWGILATQLSKFKKLDELNNFHEQAEKKIDQEVVFDYPSSSISSDKKNMLKQIVQVHHVLVKYRFLLSQFKDGDDETSFTRTLAEIEQICKSTEKLSDDINVNHIQSIFASIDQIFHEIMEAIRKKGYLRSDIEFIQNPQANNNPIIELVQLQLSKLPDVNAMNIAINGFCQAYESSDDAALEQHKALLIEYIKTIHEVKVFLEEVISKNLSVYDRTLMSLLDRHEKIIQELTQLNQYKRMDDLLALLLEIHGNDKKEGDIKKGHRELEKVAESAIKVTKDQSKSGKMTFGIVDNGGWNLAAETLQMMLMPISDELKKFIIPYATYFETINQLNLRLIKVTNEMQQLNLLCTQLAAKLDKAKAAWNACSDAISDVQITLTNHTNSKIENIKLLFLHHWGKMTIGGGCGGGSGITIAILLACEPWAIAVLIAAGVILGTGVGALIGAAADHCCPDHKGDLEKQPLLIRHNTKIVSQRHVVPFFSDNLRLPVSVPSSSQSNFNSKFLPTFFGGANQLALPAPGAVFSRITNVFLGDKSIAVSK